MQCVRDIFLYLERTLHVSFWQIALTHVTNLMSSELKSHLKSGLNTLISSSRQSTDHLETSLLSPLVHLTLALNLYKDFERDFLK